MPNILLTGVATLDIINQLSHYPAEDSEVRATAQRIQTGGNASNSAIVMQQLDLSTYLLASCADDNNALQIFSNLNTRQINTQFCAPCKNTSTPTSYITLNTSNGSRSIVHFRDLPELQAEYFISLDLNNIDWFHFEARACEQLLPMLKHARSFNQTISIELEKPREAIDEIMPYADILLISKPFALSRGFESAGQCLQFFAKQFPDTIITCTWGEQGAWLVQKSQIHHQSAFNTQPVVETLGAGDTFNAGFIAALINKKNSRQALKFACKLAAHKCRQIGFDGLKIPAYE